LAFGRSDVGVDASLIDHAPRIFRETVLRVVNKNEEDGRLRKELPVFLVLFQIISSGI
jgi:hypothetical protein